MYSRIAAATETATPSSSKGGLVVCNFLRLMLSRSGTQPKHSLRCRVERRAGEGQKQRKLKSNWKWKMASQNINICSSSHDIFTHTHSHKHTHSHTHSNTLTLTLTGAKTLNIDWRKAQNSRTGIRICPRSPLINERLK